jgi:hypothetical protein
VGFLTLAIKSGFEYRSIVFRLGACHPCNVEFCRLIEGVKGLLKTKGTIGTVLMDILDGIHSLNPSFGGLGFKL